LKYLSKVILIIIALNFNRKMEIQD